MMYDNSQTVNPMLNIGMQAVNTGFKVGGEVAKAMLLVALEKVKETKENKVGLTSLKNLAKSKDELNILSIKKENLDYFKKQCKKVGIPFGAVKGDGENVKILYKTKDVNLVKDILADLLQQEKANKLDEFQEKTVYDSISNNMDFKAINDGFHREELKGTTNEKATAIGDILRANNIDNDIVVIGVNEDNTFNIHYKINEKDKDKALKIINTNKDKSMEEILNELEKLGVHKEQAKDLKVEDVLFKSKINDGKEPLDNQIAKAEKQKQQNAKDKQAAKNKNKSKSKSEKERD